MGSASPDPTATAVCDLVHLPMDVATADGCCHWSEEGDGKRPRRRTSL